MYNVCVKKKQMMTISIIIHVPTIVLLVVMESVAVSIRVFMTSSSMIHFTVLPFSPGLTNISRLEV